jgi:hypothetical protein
MYFKAEGEEGEWFHCNEWGCEGSGMLRQFLSNVASLILLVRYQLARHTKISQCTDDCMKMWAKGLAKQKKSFYKTEGMRGRFVGENGKKYHCVLGLNGSLQLGGQDKNWPMWWRSPGEAACHYVSELIDSHAWQGTLHARAGDGRVRPPL